MSQPLPPFRPSLAHRLWRALPVTARRRMLVRMTALLAPRAGEVPAMPSRGVAIAGALSSPSGMGEAARLMVQAARAMGVRVWAIDLPAPTAWSRLRPDPGVYPPAGVPLIVHENPPTLPLALLRMPQALVRDRLIVGCWAWELPTVPPEWHAAARLVHEVWVPSAFTAQAIEPVKPHRVHVVPPALGLAPPRPSDRTRAAFGLPGDAVVVLLMFNLASSFARKNPLAAIAAFRRAFGERGDRVLVVKICHADHAPRDLAHIQAAARAANIRVVTGEMSGPDRHALIAASDIVLSLHRAEGFGLVPAEAMALGKPVVATGWSGNLDYMDRTNAGLVEYRLIEAEDDRRVYYGAPWAEPDGKDAAAWLHRLAEDPAERRRLGRLARDAVLARLNGEALRVALHAIGVRTSGTETVRAARAKVAEPVGT